MDERRRRAWHALEIGPLWRERAHAPVDADADADAGVGVGVGVGAGSGPGTAPRAELARVGGAVAACRACALCETRTRTVFGVGPAPARWMVIGEAPGAEEDSRGEPFVGQAGKLLDDMLAALGMSRDADVYIANVLKCRPPGNRDPLPEEVASCEPFLRQQVELVSPDVIVVLGRFAAQSLLACDASIASLRGRVHTYDAGGRAVPVVVSYHPAYLLRNLADKARAWADLCLATDVADVASEGAAGRRAVFGGVR